MASITLKDGKYRVQIRKKNQEISKSFSQKEDAELYAKWKEDLIDQIDNFSPSPEELLTLDSAIDMKVKDAEEKGLDFRTITSLKGLKVHFADELHRSLNELSYDFLLSKAKVFMQTEVKHGGCYSTGGNLKMPSVKTVSNRFRYLSTVIGFANMNGFSFQNHSLAILNYLNTLNKQE